MKTWKRSWNTIWSCAGKRWARKNLHAVFLLVRSHVASLWTLWEVNSSFITFKIIAKNFDDCSLRWERWVTVPSAHMRKIAIMGNEGAAHVTIITSFQSNVVIKARRPPICLHCRITRSEDLFWFATNLLNTKHFRRSKLQRSKTFSLYAFERRRTLTQEHIVKTDHCRKFPTL